MAERHLCYSIPEGMEDGALLELIQASNVLLAEPACQQQWIYHDSFDWRLYQAGGVLEERDGHIEWRDLKSGELLEQLALTSGVPRFTWDMPVGRFRNRLEPILEMRALLPRLLVDSKISQFRLLNEDKKTVLRLSLEHSSCSLTDAGDLLPVGRRLRLLPVRGYDQALQQMQHFLRTKVKLMAAPPTLLQLGLAALGCQPGDYSSKLDFKLDPTQRADEALQGIQLHLLNTMESNIPGAKADLDSEFLHDLRVAVRRARSALSQIKGVFMDEDVKRFSSSLAWVGKITGQTRDMDVYLLDFDRYRHILPREYRSDLEPLHFFLYAHQKSEQRAMVQEINSPRFRTFCKEWRAFLETPPPKVPLTPNAIRPIREIANKRIDKVFRQVLKDGMAITANSPAEELHELRKSCKKLRYLMEFFQSLYPQKKLLSPIKALKKLLNNLGDFQDLEVQANKMKGFAHQMVVERSVPADTLLAMGMLVDDMLKRQRLARTKFADCFADFASRENRKILCQLCSGKAQGGSS